LARGRQSPACGNPSRSAAADIPQIPGRLPLRWSQQEQIKKPGLLAAQVTATFAGLPELVGFLTSFLRRFDRRHPIVPICAKRIAIRCAEPSYRKACGSPVSADEENGPLLGIEPISRAFSTATGFLNRDRLFHGCDFCTDSAFPFYTLQIQYLQVHNLNLQQVPVRSLPASTLQPGACGRTTQSEWDVHF
jgi:hypothetical protein